MAHRCCVPAFNQGVLDLSGSRPALPEATNTKLGQPLFDLALAQQNKNKLRSAIVQELYGEFRANKMHHTLQCNIQIKER